MNSINGQDKEYTRTDQESFYSPRSLDNYIIWKNIVHESATLSRFESTQLLNTMDTIERSFRPC